MLDPRFAWSTLPRTCRRCRSRCSARALCWWASADLLQGLHLRYEQIQLLLGRRHPVGQGRRLCSLGSNTCLSEFYNKWWWWGLKRQRRWWWWWWGWICGLCGGGLRRRGRQDDFSGDAHGVEALVPIVTNTDSWINVGDSHGRESSVAPPPRRGSRNSIRVCSKLMSPFHTSWDT
jgi:hypothetical protein